MHRGFADVQAEKDEGEGNDLCVILAIMFHHRIYSAHFPSPSFIVSEVLSHRNSKSLILATLEPLGCPSGHSHVDPNVSRHLQQRSLGRKLFPSNAWAAKLFSSRKLSPIIAKFFTPSFWFGKLAFATASLTLLST